MTAGRERPLRVVLVGWGAIGRAVGTMLAASGEADRVRIVAVGVRDAGIARQDLPEGAELIDRPDHLDRMQPDVVAEAAGRASVQPWGEAALSAGADLIVSSVSAFADAGTLSSMRALAEEYGSRIHIQPGALVGVDALSAARPMGIERVEHRIVKPPLAWSGTPADERFTLESLDARTVIFEGTAAETASAFPKNANVAMTTALAGIGPDLTSLELVADPAATTNRHEISAYGAFGRLDVSIANNPLPGNPKSSAMAALALVRTIEHRTSTILI